MIPRRIVCVCGPTASGKTERAVELAQAGGFEIVSVDSALVYRGMDIGTAKPSSAERGGVPHHLIDIRDPWQPYSAADFAADARQAIDDIVARGRQPLLVGGTMLYFKALFDGLDALPAADPGVRAEIEAEARSRGWPALHARLSEVDPVTAARLAPHDAQRIGRALEVHRQTGSPLSALQGRRREAAPGGLQPLYLSLEPPDRAWLHARIEQRMDRMLQEGLVEEVQRLRADPRVHAGLPALRAVGYRQVLEALEALGTPFADPADAGWKTPNAVEDLRRRCVAATRQLAKRQLTWLRSLPQRICVPFDAQNSRFHRLDTVMGQGGGY